MLKPIADFRFTQELKDRWIQRYQETPKCSGTLKKEDCLCAYGSLFDVLVDDGYAEWGRGYIGSDGVPEIDNVKLNGFDGEVEVHSFSAIRAIPYFQSHMDYYDKGAVVRSNGRIASPMDYIWMENDEQVCEGENYEHIVEFIRGLPVEKG